MKKWIILIIALIYYFLCANMLYAAANAWTQKRDLYANFTGYGLYKWDGTTWSQLNSVVAAIIITGF